MWHCQKENRYFQLCKGPDNWKILAKCHVRTCDNSIGHLNNSSVVKHFHNDSAELVAGALKSLTRLNPSVAIDEKHKVVYIKQTKHPQVSVISGGGSGHEPSFGSLVGHGLLSGAVMGSIFASPSSEQIQQCLLRCVDAAKGIMVIIMNYTGDVMHFGMAVEKARARGIEVDMLVVGDDVGVGRARSGKIGRRGIAGTLLVQKIASAAAATGYVHHKTSIMR